jgi:hypothetical protein
VIQYRASCEPECCELVIKSDDPNHPVKVLDVVAYTRCRCKKKCECEDQDCCGGERGEDRDEDCDEERDGVRNKDRDDDC